MNVTDEPPAGDGGGRRRGLSAGERAELERIMKALAAGDRAFVFTLYNRFGDRIGAKVRHVLRDLGRPDLAASDDEVGGFVLDVCLLLAERAGGWRPGGALPWVWADRAVRSEIARLIGHRTVPLVPDGGDADGDGGVPEGPLVVRCGTDGEPTPGDGCSAATVFAHHPGLALLAEAIRSVGSARAQDILLEYALQCALGDPSPSHTVARITGLSPDNVRQIAGRQRRRVQALVKAEDRFAPLRGLKWFTPRRRVEAA